MSEYDVIVIGAGPVGENAADYAHQGGLSVALVEAERVGGECSYWACIPSKALLRTPMAVAAARKLPGVTAEFDPKAVFARRDYFTSRGDDSGQAEWVASAGITLVRGHGRLVGEKRVQVGDQTLTARRAVVLATGSSPVRPPIPGIDSVRTWGSREATSADAVPPRLGVLGGGVVGCEMAQAYARLGAQVTMLVRGRLLPAFEEVVAEKVEAGLRADGVDVRYAGLDAVAPGILLTVGAETIEVDELLLATGRRANTADLGLESVGLDGIEADDSGLVLGDWLYAVGDVAGKAPLTHQGKYEARIAGAAIVARAAGRSVDPAPWSEYAATADHVAVPQVVFTDPEVAHVGRTAGPGDREIVIDIAVAGSSLEADGYDGKAIMVVDPAREVIVGATFVGQDVAEMLHAATIAIVGEVPLGRLWHAVPAFPTISEVWLRLLEAYRAG